MTLYHTATQEDYDALMIELNGKGYEWRSKRSLLSNNPNNWFDFMEQTCVETEPEFLKVSYRTLKKEDKNVVEYKAEISEDNINKPNHYIGIHGLEVEEVLQNFIPRYENSYAGHRVASAIEYLLRAPLKNKLEDIEKAKQNLEQILNYEKEQPHE